MFPSHILLRFRVEISMMLALGFVLGRVNAESNSIDFSNESAAHVQFDKMLAAMRVAESLSYESDYVWTIDDKLIGDFKFRVWLKKPNHFRVEVEAAKSGEKQGILIGDGEHAWLHWPNGRPQWGLIPEDPDTYQKTRFTQYRKQKTPAGDFSIAHAMVYTAKMMGMPTLNPSSFFGFGSSLDQHLDGVRSVGDEEIDGRIFDCLYS
jgi:outer membrane lipoprotein-sorting protein